MILYGQALMQDEATAIELLAEQMANLALEYLEKKESHFLRELTLNL